MSQARCSKCNGPIDPQGRCPACLMDAALDTSLREAMPPTAGAADRARAPELQPDIPSYRILRTLGEGGMGIVYLAQQSEPVSRQVALKVIRSGPGDRHAAARFEAERQALARLDHPVIAKVFDAGQTSDDRLYFAMEYVEGERITDYCDSHRLTTRDRLDLLAQVCDGVQHAHQRGIIHRDLKPSNVLVGSLDGRAFPKIIDFGVAKATEQRLTERSLMTELGVLLGTPEYMSPEQAGMGPLDVDTRTDVYALGVLLYELLTGRLPLDPERMRAAPLVEVLRRIQEEIPARPSLKITGLAEQGREIALLRSADPAALCRQLAGDLDVITMKALEKERDRRYGSATELAADLRRHLNDEPVLARPPSTGYQLRKLIARNKLPSAFAVVLLLALLAFSTSVSLLYRRSQQHLGRALTAESAAAREASTSRQVSDFLIGLFQGADPGRTGGQTVTARDLLDDGAERIGKELAEQPTIQAEMQAVLGSLYYELGVYDESIRLLEQSLEQRRRLLADGHADVAESAGRLAVTLNEVGEHDRGEALHREALGIYERAAGPDSPEVVSALDGLGLTLAIKSDYDAAIPLLERALEICRSDPVKHEKGLPSVLHNLGQTLKWKGDYAEAEPIYREALELRTRRHGLYHPSTAVTMNNMGSMFNEQGRYEEAERYTKGSLDIWIRLLGEDHADVALARNNLAMLYTNMGRHREAVPLMEQAIAANRKIHGERSERVATELGNLGGIKSELGEHEEALRLRRQALAIGREVFQGVHMVLGHYLTGLGDELVVAGRYEEAEENLEAAIGMYDKTVTPDHPRRGRALLALGEMRLNQGRLGEAEKVLREAVSIFEHQLVADAWRLSWARCLLGECLARARRSDEARPLLEAGHAELLAKRGEGDRRTQRSAGALALLRQP